MTSASTVGTSYSVGSLVKARGREWVVLPESNDQLLVLRPLGGTDDETTGIYLPLEKVEEEKQQPTNQNEKQKINQDQLSAEEIATLRKLVSIRFVDRVPNHVETVLNSHEKETLKLLQKKNLINIFRQITIRFNVVTNIIRHRFFMGRPQTKPVIITIFKL